MLIDIQASDPNPNTSAQLADTVADVMTELVADLERPLNAGVPAVQVRLVQPAPVPTDPSSPSMPSLATFGALGGLIIGAAIVVVRNSLDTAIRDTDTIVSATSAPNLGSIAFEPTIETSPLPISTNPRGRAAEAFRHVRTNLQFVDIDQENRVFAVTSSLPAEGKSTLTANLGLALAATGEPTLLIEADLRRPKLAELFGLEGSIGMTTVLTGQTHPSQAIQNWRGQLDVLASGQLPPNPSELLGSNAAKKLIADLRPRYRNILIDTPPILPVTDAAALSSAVDGVILVVSEKQTSIGQLRGSVDRLHSAKAIITGTVFTMVQRIGDKSGYYGGTYYQTEPSKIAKHNQQR
ncbi:polysaccharide biosynthesis tyrosine autokinase [Pseudonocardia halophobica]|uniref:polysaccharide biosynthesis tyrosine autokinase n=1 Tax=Pseudonocardia halophobica TaxID=29401 RepID=UPI001E5649D9|nr:polysaccharide biosynthesis tyrosine autokinase [Pseudonocardia halophobica]